MPAVGHIYILVNPSHRLLKIGKTTKSPEERAAELSSETGIPAPFMVAYCEKVSDCDLAEKIVHAELAAFRTNADREFFAIALKDAVKVVSKVADNFPISITAPKEPEDEMSIWLRQSLKAQEIYDASVNNDAITIAWLQRTIQSLPKMEKECAKKQPENSDRKIIDAVLALMSLGFKQIEAHDAVRSAQCLLGAKATVEDLVRACLKKG